MGPISKLEASGTTSVKRLPRCRALQLWAPWTTSPLAAFVSTQPLLPAIFPELTAATHAFPKGMPPSREAAPHVLLRSDCK